MNKQTNDIILEVLEPYNPREIGVFGSYARNENKTNSDIDILVSFASAVSLFDLARIINKFKNNYGLTIDLVEKEGLSDSFLKEISPELQYILRHVNRSA